MAAKSKPCAVTGPRIRPLRRRGCPPARGKWDRRESEVRSSRVHDHFLTRTGRRATVAGLSIRVERIRVYNLNVNTLHNYAVGECGVLVHNTCRPPRIKPPPYPAKPDVPPGPGWKWHGGKKGQWHDKKTGRSMHPHLDDPIHGPHWDYRHRGSGTRGWRYYPDGTLEPR
jgi:hypothetical protein